MARRKTLPESLRAKLDLAERLAILRLELFGERGGPEMARRLGIPVRTWYNYEGGVTVPAEVVLKIIELTAIEPGWLLHGRGPKFRNPTRAERTDAGAQPTMMVGALLRTALQLLEGETPPEPEGPSTRSLESDRLNLGGHRLESHGTTPEDAEHDMLRSGAHDRTTVARAEWIEARRENRCLHVDDDSMAPVIAKGASVAYSRDAEDATALDGKIVVAWIDRNPLIRWYQDCGRYALLRAENQAADPQQTLIDLEAPDLPKFRRVLWIETPH
jgi:Peptidase S24-like